MTNHSMLQPFPVRPVFRFLAAPLGLLVICGGCTLAYFGIVNVFHAEWVFAPFLLLGPAVAIYGVLMLLIAFTSALPAWVVGEPSDDSSHTA